MSMEETTMGVQDCDERAQDDVADGRCHVPAGVGKGLFLCSCQRGTRQVTRSPLDAHRQGGETMETFDLVATLQALPETDPIEVEGIDLGKGARTCQAACVALTVNVIQTVCAIVATC